MTDKVNKIRIFFILTMLLFPALHLSGQTSDSPNLRTVVIDPGHGGKDPGAPGPDSKHSEKHIVYSISKKFGDKIKKAYPSVKVVYTRNGDTFPKLTDRVKTAHDNNADLFISIHCNSSSAKSARGSSAHILSRKDSQNPDRDLFDENLELTKLENSVIEYEEDQSSYKDTAEDQILNALLFHANFDHSVMLAQMVVNNLATDPFRPWGKGIHQNDFLLLKKMTCPAILIETAFLSNSEERKLLVSDKWQEEIAERLFKAFREYKTIYDGSMTSAPEPVIEMPTQLEPPKTNEIKEPEIPLTGDEYYSIQIMGLGRLLFNNDPAFKGLKAKAVKGKDSNIYKYVCGQYKTKEEAGKQLASIKEKFPEAYLVKVSGDKVISVQ